MFGNLKGWVVSGVIFAIVAFVFVKAGLLTVPPISKPSGKIKFAEKLALPSDPSAFLPKPSTAGNAAETYRLAIHEYDTNEKLYAPDGTYGKSATALADTDPKGIQLVVEAAKYTDFDLFASRPEQVVHYNSTWPDLTAIERMGMHTLTAGAAYRNRKDVEKAEQYLSAGFLLGYRLYNERLVWQELNAGLNLMINASSQLAKLYHDRGDEAKSLACKQFFDELDKYKKDKIVTPIVTAVTSIDTRKITDRGGDFFGLVRESPERVWKVEALLALGRMKFNTSNRGDQIGATREVKKYLADPDPAVRLAAKLADEMTIERYRMLGG